MLYSSALVLFALELYYFSSVSFATIKAFKDILKVTYALAISISPEYFSDPVSSGNASSPEK